VEQLLFRADTKIVGGHQRNLLQAIAQHVTRGKFREGGGFADTGRADQRNHAALVQRLGFNDGQAVGEKAHGHVTRLRCRHFGGQLRNDFAGNVGIQSHPCELTQHAGLHRAPLAKILPRHSRKLRLQHAAQIGQLALHAFVFRRRGACHRRYSRRLAKMAAVARADIAILVGISRGRCEALRVIGNPADRFGQRWPRGTARRRRRWTRHRSRVLDIKPAGIASLCRGFADQRLVVIDGGNDFEPLVGATRRQDDRVGPLVLAHLAHRLTHVVGNKTFDFHADLHANFLQQHHQPNSTDSTATNPVPRPDAPVGCPAPRCRPAHAVPAPPAA